MAVSQRLEVRQTQSLVMTPQLQQAIKLLQLSNLELADYIDRELERNPLLEREEADGTTAGDPSPPAEAPGAAEGDRPGTAEGESPADAAQGADAALDFSEASAPPDAADSPLDTDFEELYDTTPADGWSPSDGGSSLSTAGPGGTGSGGFEDDGPGLEQRLSENVTLRAHLLNQLQLELTDPADRMIGMHLIDMLDEAGYLTGELSGVAALLGCGEARVAAALKRLQAFDPPGIFARDLKECLALQLADRNRLDPAIQALLDNLELLARRELAKLKRICDVDDEDLSDMIAEIRALDPKPALAFDSRVAEPVVPDVLLRPGPGGGWLLELNNETLPRVLVNRQYYAQLAKSARVRRDKEYISEALQSANWLVKSLHQRATTILKVSTEIVRLQDAFFRKGVQHLRPLTLRDVADAIEMHESTVSRVTSNKFMATPRGTFELKYFFTSAIASTHGEAHSAESVRHRIRGLIDAEIPSKVLSDDSIVDLLGKEGIEIARRTVAKYREAMRIPSSVERRRQKAMQL